MRRIVILTHFTSPYQVELFDAIAKSGRCSLDVLYLHSTDRSRNWSQSRIDHQHLVLSHGSQNDARRRVAAADLAVFNFYDDSRVAVLMKARILCGKPWCFWGERRGVRSSGWLGHAYRQWRLMPLRKSRAAIWGIGRFAVEAYTREFGMNRPYHDVPYFSNLSRFAIERHGRHAPGQTTFLCSGALIRRKGVDLLARAFVRLAADGRNVRLKFVGEGELRAELEQELRPVADRVEFAGFKDWGRLPSEYRSADILCAPSRHDGWGLVVPEALAAGLPVIGTDRTGAALELIQPRKNGWLIPADDDTALYHAMADAAGLSDGDLRACSTAATASVARHRLADGVDRFLAAAEQSLESWQAAAA